ncbi:putative calpain-like cysteine peptidase, partial [Trypanosoma grayi]|uniref:putative calpain-like cysteine peptidase n=1 Tax=Trypanosoma grayi TaxID=71804 RepID=UPI0004F4BAE2
MCGSQWGTSGAVMTSACEMYRRECSALHIPPNSGLLRMLPGGNADMSGVTVMHFGRNFLGDRGVVPLLRVIGQATALHTLNLRDNGIGNGGVKALCSALRKHPSLKVLELSGNPFTYLAARQLVHLCEDSGSIAFIGVENTLMTETLKASIVRRLQEALRRRESRKRATQASPNAADSAAAAATPHTPPRLAEGAAALHRLSAGSAVDPAALFARRTPSGRSTHNDSSGEVASTGNRDVALES